MKKFLKKAEGFTLVELIVVIAILGILAGVAVPAYTGYIKKANDAAVVTELSAIKTAADATATEKQTTVEKITVAAAGTVTVEFNDIGSTTVADVTELKPYYDVATNSAALKTKLEKSASYTAGAEWTSAGWAGKTN